MKSRKAISVVQLFGGDTDTSERIEKCTSERIEKCTLYTRDPGYTWSTRGESCFIDPQLLVKQKYEIMTYDVRLRDDSGGLRQ